MGDGTDLLAVQNFINANVNKVIEKIVKQDSHFLHEAATKEQFQPDTSKQLKVQELWGLKMDMKKEGSDKGQKFKSIEQSLLNLQNSGDAQQKL